MKATLIIDAEGPNPDFKPPARHHFPDGPEGDEAHADALAGYDVPHSQAVPAGTVIAGRGAWVHCYPDESGHVVELDANTRRILKVSRRPGVVRAIPADAACQKALDKHVAHAAAARKVPIAVIQKEISDGVAASRKAQAAAEAARAAPDAPAPAAQPAA